MSVRDALTRRDSSPDSSCDLDFDPSLRVDQQHVLAHCGQPHALPVSCDAASKVPAVLWLNGKFFDRALCLLVVRELSCWRCLSSQGLGSSSAACSSIQHADCQPGTEPTRTAPDSAHLPRRCGPFSAQIQLRCVETPTWGATTSRLHCTHGALFAVTANLIPCVSPGRRRCAGACGHRSGREGADESGPETFQRRIRRGVVTQSKAAILLDLQILAS